MTALASFMPAKIAEYIRRTLRVGSVLVPGPVPAVNTALLQALIATTPPSFEAIAAVQAGRQAGTATQPAPVLTGYDRSITYNHRGKDSGQGLSSMLIRQNVSRTVFAPLPANPALWDHLIQAGMRVLAATGEPPEPSLAARFDSVIFVDPVDGQPRTTAIDTSVSDAGGDIETVFRREAS